MKCLSLLLRPKISPTMQTISVISPAISNVFSVIHVWQKNILYSIICLLLRLFHCESCACYYQRSSSASSYNPLIIYKFYIFNMNAFKTVFLFERNYGALGIGQKCFIVSEWIRRQNQTYSN